MWDDIMTVREVASFLRVSRITVWRMCSTGELEAFRVGREWRVDRSQVEKLVGHATGLGSARVQAARGAEVNVV